MTLSSIKKALPELTSQQISMSLCYLKKKQLIDRSTVERPSGFGRAKVWSYTIKTVEPSLGGNLQPQQ